MLGYAIDFEEISREHYVAVRPAKDTVIEGVTNADVVGSGLGIDDGDIAIIDVIVGNMRRQVEIDDTAKEGPFSDSLPDLRTHVTFLDGERETRSVDISHMDSSATLGAPFNMTLSRREGNL